MRARYGWLLALVLVMGCLRQGEDKTTSAGANAVDAEAQAELNQVVPLRKGKEFEPVPAGKPITLLPAGVVAPPGKLTLFANYQDFERDTRPNSNWINGVVYLVNRTGKPVPLNHYEGYLYILQEYEAAPGKWKLAEVYCCRGCGNAKFHPPSLKDNHYLPHLAQYPANGLKARIRYSLYNQPVTVSSNVTEGFVDLEEVRAAAEKGAIQFGELWCRRFGDTSKGWYRR